MLLIKKQISEKSLIKRINRALVKEGQMLKTNRSKYADYNSDAGRYYIVDCYINAIVASHCDLEELALELCVLKPSEELAA